MPLPKPKSMYAIRSMEPTGALSNWAVIKLNTNYEPQTTYYISQQPPPSTQLICTCFAGFKHEPCRHKKMLQLFAENKRIDSGWMYIPDHRKNQDPWVAPEEN